MNPNKPVDNACAECGRYLFDLSAEQPYCSSCYEKTALALTLACAQRDALKARAEKAEAERDKAAEERGVWESEAHRLAGIVSEQTGQIENVETGARECRVTLGAERLVKQNKRVKSL